MMTESTNGSNDHTGSIEPAIERRPLGELVGQLSDDTSRLLKGELELAKAELYDKLDDTKKDALAIASGGVVALAGLLTLVAAFVLLGATVMPPGVSALVIGCSLSVVGAVMAKRGQRRMGERSLAPRQAKHNATQDISAIKREVR